MEPISTDGDPCPLLLTDREIAAQTVEQREEAARDVLGLVSDALDRASETLDDLERDRLLAPALQRVCNELADVVASVAKEIGMHDEERRRDFARACLQDAELVLFEGDTSNTASAAATFSALGNKNVRGDDQRDDDVVADLEPLAKEGGQERGVPTEHEAPPGTANASFGGRSSLVAAQKVASLSEDDMLNAVSSAATILTDVEEVLRSIGQDEAEDIAEVGVTVAKMFVWSLQSVHRSVTPQSLAGTQTDGNSGNSGELNIEFLDDENDVGLSGQESSDQRGEAIQSDPICDDLRMRCLWPPLGPAVALAGKWGADEASKRPILTVALAMALWPAALVAALIGAPLVAVDHAVQKTYEANRNSSIVAVAEHGAANLFHVGKLYYLCTKLVVKQSLRVGKKQVARRGGLGRVAVDAAGFALDRALHPIETASIALDWGMWGASTLCESAKFVKDVATGELRLQETVPTDMH